METIEKIEILSKFNVKKLKEVIKVAAIYQRFLKNQRKTVKLVGKREMSPSEAIWKHQVNREKLSIMYAAYGVMRGKDRYEQIKAHISKKGTWFLENVENKVEKLLDEYRN